MHPVVSFCRELYYGSTPRALKVRYSFLALDLLIIAYFITTTFLPLDSRIIAVDFVIGVVLLIDLIGRVIADTDRVGMLTRPFCLFDIAIILSLFLPAIYGSFVFLRVLRAMRIVRSYQLTRSLRHYSKFFAHNEEVIFSAINLLVFIFVVTAVVFVMQQASNPSINNYIDALYFTITTLTTTGFGDIILIGSTGRLLAVLIMIIGVALFIRLVQTIFRPNKVRHECTTCGLTRHDLDAVHCKHCGHELRIRTEGAY